MDTKIKEIRELKRMQEELVAELDALVDGQHRRTSQSASPYS